MFQNRDKWQGNFILGKKNGIGILTKVGGEVEIVEYRMDTIVES